MPISSSSSHTFKQRWELLKPTLAASTSSDDSTSSSASSSSPRFPPVGLRTHYPNPYSARRYDAVDLDAMAKMSASKPPARRSSKAREKEAAALPAQSEPMQVDRQTSEAAAGEAASPEQIQDEAGRTHEAKASRRQYEAVRRELKTLDFGDARYLEAGVAVGEVDRLLGSLTIAPLEAMRAEEDEAGAWEERVREAVGRIWVAGTSEADKRARCEEVRELLAEVVADSLRRESDTAYRGREVRRAVLNAGLRQMLD